MYSPRVVAANLAKLEEAFRVTLAPHTPDECAEMEARLRDAVDDDGQPQRALTKAEQSFVRDELLLCKADFAYWATRWMKITSKQGMVQPLFPLLDSQQFVLDKIAELEEAAYDGARHDGILVIVLKAARQVGVSTLFEGIGTHRTTTQDNQAALIASDTPDNSGYLFGMQETIVAGLPWWLRPTITDHVKNTEIAYDGGSHVWVGSGKSMKGQEGTRGQLGRGRTILFTHLSELSTWENPDQLNASLFPAIPENPRSFAGLETTAQGRGVWIHKFWKSSRAGRTRFRCIYIPWYVEKTYSRPAPADWVPATTTLEHAKRIEATSAHWVGSTYVPTREEVFIAMEIFERWLMQGVLNQAGANLPPRNG